MKQRYLITHIIVIMSILLGFPLTLFAQEPTIEKPYSLISKKRISRTVSEYVYKASLINGDKAIKNISATTTSNSSFTTVIDGEVNFNDMEAGATVESSDTFTIQQDRREAFGPESLSWNVSFEPDVQAGLEIDGRVDIRRSARLRLGKMIKLHNGYKFYEKNDKDFSITVEHKFEPEQGLALSPLINDVLSSSTGEIVEFVSQFLSATEAGQYVMTTTATVLETGEKFTTVTEVFVSEGELPPDIGLLSSSPPALKGNTLTDVLFSINVDGKFANITGVKMKNLQDDSNIILKGDRGSYSETIEVDTENMAPGDCLSYQAIFETTIGIFNSDVHKLCVTRFPLRFQRTTERIIVTDSETGVQASADEVLIIVKKGISEEEVEAIAVNVNGHVTHVSPQIRSYQIQLDAAVTSMEELYTIVSQLTALPNVEHAAPNALLKINSLETTDELLNIQNHLDVVRAREAWFVNRGSKEHIITIVDSGIDIEHPDLKNKIIGGDNFAAPYGLPSLSDDYSDVMGHGTHVAGIVAAETDNSIGVAGVSWENPLLIAKVTSEFSLSGDAFLGSIRRGIFYAVDNKVKIIVTTQLDNNYKNRMLVNQSRNYCRIIVNEPADAAKATQRTSQCATHPGASTGDYS